MNLLELKNISKAFSIGRTDLKSSLLFSNKQSESFILRDINLTLKRGESLGVIGLNGSGKSTLLKIIAGLISPTSGSRQLNGKVNPVANIFGSLHSELSIEENIRFFFSITDIIDQDEDDFVKKVLEFSELTHKKNYISGHLSTGEEARLSFSMTMFCEAELYLLDECLSVGDIFFKEKCRRFISQLKGQGKSLITVSHDHDDILNLCDRVVWIKDGHIVREGVPSYLLEEYARR